MKKGRFIFGVFFLLTLFLVVFLPLTFASSWTKPIRITNNLLEEHDPAIAVYQDKTYITFSRWLDNSNEDVFYSTNASGSWKTIRLTNDGVSKSNTDIAIDRDGKLHIVYVKRENVDSLIYKTNASGSWQTTTIKQSDNIITAPSIAAYNGKVFIVYTILTADTQTFSWKGEVWYSSNILGNWSQVKLAASNGMYSSASIAQRKGIPHIVLAKNPKGSNNENDYQIFYLKTTDQANWSLTQLTFNSTADAVPDVAVDSLGKAHVVFLRGESSLGKQDGGVYYKTNRSGSWYGKRISPGDSFFGMSSPSIAYSSNQIFVSWLDWQLSNTNIESEVFFRQKDLTTNTWSPIQRLTNNTLIEDNPSITAYNGSARLVYERWDEGEFDDDSEIILRKQY